MFNANRMSHDPVTSAPTGKGQKKAAAWREHGRRQGWRGASSGRSKVARRSGGWCSCRPPEIPVQRLGGFDARVVRFPVFDLDDRCDWHTSRCADRAQRGKRDFFQSGPYRGHHVHAGQHTAHGMPCQPYHIWLTRHTVCGIVNPSQAKPPSGAAARNRWKPGRTRAGARNGPSGTQHAANRSAHHLESSHDRRKPHDQPCYASRAPPRRT